LSRIKKTEKSKKGAKNRLFAEKNLEKIVFYNIIVRFFHKNQLNTKFKTL